MDALIEPGPPQHEEHQTEARRILEALVAKIADAESAIPNAATAPALLRDLQANSG